MNQKSDKARKVNETAQQGKERVGSGIHTGHEHRKTRTTRNTHRTRGKSPHREHHRGTMEVSTKIKHNTGEEQGGEDSKEGHENPEQENEDDEHERDIRTVSNQGNKAEHAKEGEMGKRTHNYTTSRERGEEAKEIKKAERNQGIKRGSEECPRDKASPRGKTNAAAGRPIKRNTQGKRAKIIKRSGAAKQEGAIIIPTKARQIASGVKPEAHKRSPAHPPTGRTANKSQEQGRTEKQKKPTPRQLNRTLSHSREVSYRSTHNQPSAKTMSTFLIGLDESGMYSPDETYRVNLKRVQKELRYTNKRPFNKGHSCDGCIRSEKWSSSSGKGQGTDKAYNKVTRSEARIMWEAAAGEQAEIILIAIHRSQGEMVLIPKCTSLRCLRAKPDEEFQTSGGTKENTGREPATPNMESKRRKNEHKNGQTQGKRQGEPLPEGKASKKRAQEPATRADTSHQGSTHMTILRREGVYSPASGKMLGSVIEVYRPFSGCHPDAPYHPSNYPRTATDKASAPPMQRAQDTVPIEWHRLICWDHAQLVQTTEYDAMIRQQEKQAAEEAEHNDACELCDEQGHQMVCSICPKTICLQCYSQMQDANAGDEARMKCPYCKTGQYN